MSHELPCAVQRIDEDEPIAYGRRTSGRYEFLGHDGDSRQLRAQEFHDQVFRREIRFSDRRGIRFPARGESAPEDLQDWPSGHDTDLREKEGDGSKRHAASHVSFAKRQEIN